MKGKILALFLGFAVALSLVASAQRTGGFPSRPRFQAVTVGSGSLAATGSIRLNAPGTTTDPSLDLDSTRPVIGFNESDAAADNRLWAINVDAENLSIRACSDGGACSIPIAVDRTGNVTDNLSLSGSTVTANGQFIATTPGNAGLVASMHAISTLPQLNFIETDASTDNGAWAFLAEGEDFAGRVVDDSGTPVTNFLVVQRTGTTVDSIGLSATDVTINGVSIVASTGTFSASFDTACSTTPTVTFDYVRVGNMVTLFPNAQTGFSCTGDSTLFATTGTPVPAALRPAFPVNSHVLDGFTNNSAPVWGQMQIGTTGNIAYHLCSALTADCNVTGWTASGNRAAALNTPVTYILGDP